MTVQEIHEATGKLIAAGHGDAQVIDIDNRTFDSDYVVESINWAENLGAVTIEFDEIVRGVHNE